MSVIKKTLFAENLDNVPVLITDTEANSKYFKISELSDTFTGGKNAFLIQGSEFLVPDTIVKIEIKDAKGNIIYHEPGEGMVNTNITDVNGNPIITEYYEGASKVVAVYIYPDTAYGNCTITILGEAKDVSSEWEGIYNVKWQKQINVNPALANTTKIRFYQRPVVSISETLSPIYTIVSGSKVESNVVSSFANVRISQMETFAGDVKRIKVFRTSLGDISDSDLIQDILVESKELLTSYELSGSVVGNSGLFTSEVLSKLWTADDVTTELTSSRIDNGVKLNGSGYFRYTSSLNLSNVSVYELGIDAFYSSSTASNLGIYVSGSNNGEYLIGTLYGITPTKNLKDQTIQFTLPKAEPTASLYLSQSQSEWHVGNISLKLSQDTAFSPSEIEFVTSMPTVIGNETYQFNFEFYDVNNNFVPIAVTQSALFTGGNNNVGGTISLISSSASSSLSQLYAVSSSISGTAILYLTSSIATSSVFLTASLQTSSLYLTASIATASYSASVVSASVYTLSGSVSSSIAAVSSSVSQSVYNGLLTAFTKVQDLADGNYSGSFISGNIVYAPVIGGQLGYFSTLFKVGPTSPIYLDARQTPRKIFIGGVNETGSYNNSNTSVYMDSDGKFSLKDKLTWDGTTLNVNGNINITGGTAQTQLSAVGTATGSLQSQLNGVGTSTGSIQTQLASVGTATGSLQSSITAANDKIFTDALGRITKAPTPGSTAGLYLGNTNLGYYNGSQWRTYMDNTGLFYLTGSANGNALLWDGTTLTIKGNLSVGSSVPNSVVTGLGTLATANSVTTAQVTGLGVLATRDTVAATHIDASAVTNAKIAADAVTEGKIAADAVTSGKISANAVVAGKIAADAVTADKIAAGAITAGKIAAGAIEADKIAAGAITAGKIAAGAVTADKVDVAGVISAGSIIVAGNNVSSLTNDSGFQNNGSAKTGGSVGGWAITSDQIQGGSPSGGTDGSYTTQGIRLGSSGWISSKNFYIDSSGNASFKGTLSVTSGTIGGWSISANALESTGGVIKLYASDSNPAYQYGWIEMGSGTQFYNKGGQFWVDYSGPGGAWTYREMSMPFLDPSLIYGVSSAYSVRFRTQAAGEGAILALAASSGNVSLYGNGRVYAGGVNLTSDRRLKDRIKELDSKFGIEFLNKLKPVEYAFKDNIDSKKFGFIAQEVTASMAEYGMDVSNSSLVSGDINKPEVTMHLSYTELIAPLVKAVQQLSEKVDNLEMYISSSINK